MLGIEVENPGWAQYLPRSPAGRCQASEVIPILSSDLGAGAGGGEALTLGWVLAHWPP